MSQSNTKPVTVKPESLPLSLRHASEDDCLLQAEGLAQFLQEATVSMLKDGQEYSNSDVSHGLEQAFYLLRDKLAILSGTLKIPMTSYNAVHKWDPSVVVNEKQGGGV